MRTRLGLSIDTCSLAQAIDYASRNPEMTTVVFCRFPSDAVLWMQAGVESPDKVNWTISVDYHAPTKGLLTTGLIDGKQAFKILFRS